MSGPADPALVAGVLFDLDGTLYAPPRLLELRVALACAGDLGLLRRLGSVRRELAGRCFSSEAALWEEHHALLARRCGATPERARRFYDGRFMPAFVEVLRRHARPRPGLASLVRQLAARGVVCCVLSDFGRVEERLQALGLAPGLFHGCASTAASGALKPAPRAFLQMAERFGLSPERWLVVGDRADTDGAGAAAAGMAFAGLASRRGAAAPGFEPWERLARRLSDLGPRTPPPPSVSLSA